MAIPVAKRRYTVEEYLALEAKADFKSEFHDGEILAMAGGTYRHSRICTNVLIAIGTRLRGHPCQITESNTRVAVKSRIRYVYPDATVVCGSPQFDPSDKNRTTIINPTLLVEVLSEGTEAYDRGDKFDAFRDLPTLKEYVIVASARPLVESFYRQDDGTWSLAFARGGDAPPYSGKLALRSIGLELDLAEVYDRVEFDPLSPPSDGAPTDVDSGR